MHVGDPASHSCGVQMGAASMWNILEGHELPEYGQLPSAGKSGSGTEVGMSCPVMVAEEEASWSPLGIGAAPRKGPGQQGSPIHTGMGEGVLSLSSKTGG